MFRTMQSLVFITYLALGLVAVGSAQAGDVFKGSVKGDATFGPGGPPSGFETNNAIGTITHLGKTSVALEMRPSENADGTPAKGLSGGATLTAANRDELDMLIVTDDPKVSFTADTRTDVFEGAYQMVGGTGRFADASIASRIKITITCNFKREVWTITIEW